MVVSIKHVNFKIIKQFEEHSVSDFYSSQKLLAKLKSRRF